MFLFQVASGKVDKSALPEKKTVEQRVYDYINSTPKKPYPGPTPTAAQSKELASLSSAVWEKYGFGKMKLPPAVKTAFVGKEFGGEFETSVYVMAGIMGMVEKKGPIKIKLADGSEITISKDTLTPEMLERTIAFTALNAAIKGRVGTTKDAHLDDNIVLHTLLSLHNSSKGASEFFTDKNVVDWAKLEKMRPTSVGNSKSLIPLSTVLDKTPLKESYNSILKAVSGSGMSIYRQFIEQGYKPTNPSKTQGNVELIFLTHLVKADSELSAKFKPADDRGRKPAAWLPPYLPELKIPSSLTPVEEVKKPDIFGNGQNNGEGQNQSETKKLNSNSINLQTRALTNLFGSSGSKLTQAQLDTIPTEIGALDPLIRDPKQLFNDIFSGAKSVTITDSNGNKVKLSSFNYGSMKKLVDYIVDNTKGKDNGSFIATIDDGSGSLKQCEVAYNTGIDGINHTFSVTVSPPQSGGNTTFTQPSAITITGAYSSVYGNANKEDVTVNSANFLVQTKGANFSGVGSYSYANNEISNGSFGLKLDLNDSQTGRTAHVYLSGADIDLVQGSFGKVSFNEDDPMKSTVVISGTTYTLHDLLHNDNSSLSALKDALGDSFKGGYLSLDAGIDSFGVKIDRLDMKNFKTMKNLQINAGATAVNFANNEFNLDYASQSGLLKDGVSFQWKANGSELVRVSVPALTDEQDKNVTAALNAFTDTISGIDFKNQNIYSAISDAVSILANTLTDRNDPKYADLLNSIKVNINMSNLLSSFQGGSFIGDLAKNGLAPALQKDLPNHGNMSFTAAQIGELASNISKGVNSTDWQAKQDSWSAVDAIVRKSLGLPSGQVFMDNTVMSMYFGDFNSQQEIVERALSAGSPALQLYAQNLTSGTSERSRIGAGAAVKLMDKGDFMLFAQGGASLQNMGVSVFGNMAEQSNANYVTKSVTIDAGVGGRVNPLDIDFGAYGSVNLPYQKIIEMNNANGGTFVIPLTQYDTGHDTHFTHPEFRAYVFGKYDPLQKKVQLTVLAGLVPRYTYAGNFDSSDLRFTVGGQLKFDQPITFNIGGTTVAPDAEIIMPSFAGKSFYGKAGVSWIIPGAASGFKEFQIRGGVNYMHDDARTMATPEISATAKTDFIGKETDVTAQYLPNAVSGQLRFGVGVHW